MRYVLKIAITTLLLAMPSALWAQQQVTEELKFGPPESFERASVTNKDGVLEARFIPKGSSEQTAAQMMSVQVVLNYSGSLDDGVNNIVSQVKTDCPTATAVALKQGVQNGFNYEVSQLECPQPSEDGFRSVMMKTVKGEKALYFVRIAFKNPFSQNEVTALRQFLAPIYVCDTAKPEHPCQ